MALSETERRELKDLLLSEREKIIKESEGYLRSTKAKIEVSMINHSAVGNHAAEATIESTLVEERLSSTCVKRFRKINEALRRLDGGTFGICVACSQPIPGERLKAIPFANHCVNCKEAEEDKKSKGSPKRRSQFFRQNPLSQAYV